MPGTAVELVPALTEDREGNPCIVVLPSDKPSARSEAMAIENLLADILKQPSKAVQR